MDSISEDFSFFASHKEGKEDTAGDLPSNVSVPGLKSSSASLVWSYQFEACPCHQTQAGDKLDFLKSSCLKQNSRSGDFGTLLL